MKGILVTLGALVILASGCANKGYGDDPQRTVQPGQAYLTDPAGDAPGARWDIVEATLFELNGSFVVRVEIENYAEGLPLMEAVIQAAGNTHYSRMTTQPCGPSGLPCGEEGRGTPQDGTPLGDACWIPSFPSDPNSEDPWWIALEFLHNRTGLHNGGLVTSLTVTTRNVSGDTMDEATAAAAWKVRGGTNPYAGGDPSCPSKNERAAIFEDA